MLLRSAAATRRKKLSGNQPLLFCLLGRLPSETTQVARAKVLAVGAGGIGCELLKTLVLSGFRDVHTVR